MWEVARDAIEKKLCLELTYDGFVRVVEVHAIGESSAGHIVMRVWQVEGGSVSNERVGWKMLRLDEIRSLAICATASEAPREGFKRGDRQMRKIFAEI
jgi:hypothetical protein